MEDSGEHADRVEQRRNRAAREERLQQLIRDWRAVDGLREDAQVEYMPDEEDDEEPCRPTLQSELPVADVAVAARVVLRLKSDVDAVDGMEEDWQSDAEDFQTEEDRMRDELHHGQSTVEGLSTAECTSIRDDMLEEENADCQQAD